MYYVMSDLNGNEKAYFEIKEKFNFNAKDEMYLLGDVLGGDPEHPERSLRILDDIMNSDNIHLVFGDFEYNYAQFDWMQWDDEQGAYVCWDGEESLADTEYGRKLWGYYGGAEFVKYMETLPKQLKQKYINYLCKCNVSAVLSLGKYIFYMVHGAPAFCNHQDMVDWQKKVVDTPLDLKKDYKAEIISDDTVEIKGRYEDYEVIIIAGHVSTADIQEEESIFHNHAQLILGKDRCLIHCGRRGNKRRDKTVCCLAIDEDSGRINIHYREEQ